MLIKTVVVTPFSQNARLLIDEQRSEGVLIDPGGDAKLLLRLWRESEVQLTSIFLTHAHIDHAGAVREILDTVQRETKRRPQLVGHEADAPLRSSIAQQASFFGLSPVDYQDCPEPDVFLVQGTSWSVGELTGQVRFVPGHAPGHVVWFFPQIMGRIETVSAKGNEFQTVEVEDCAGPLLIAGDTLFRNSIGRTDLPGGDYKTLMRCIREQIFSLPVETRVLSGHGPDTTVGFEIETNPFF